MNRINSIMLSILVGFSLNLFSQNPNLNHEKYWFYKERLNKKFIKVGPLQGESIPLWTRMYEGFGSVTIDGVSVPADFTFSYGSAPYATFVMKLDVNNNLLWSTFLVKSTGNSKPVVVNNSVYVHGNCDGLTGSTEIFLLDPNDGSYFDNNTNHFGPTCISSIYLTRLTLGGQTTWSTLLGGTYLEKVAGIDFDSFGNIFLSGHSESADFIPILNASPGYYSKTDPAGIDQQDGYILAFNPQNIERWGTTFGGDYYDVVKDISLDRTNSKLYLVGDVSKSSNCFPYKDAQTWFQNTFTQGANTIAGFITQFDVSSNVNELEEMDTNSGNIKIFPNPSNGENIIISSSIAVTEINVFDLLGNELTSNYQKETNTISLSHLNCGTYLIKIKTKNSIQTLKFNKL